VFLDRDGTVIEHVHHLCRPEEVRLIEGAAAAIGELRSAGLACVVVTNQSVVGRGKLTLSGLEEIHQVMQFQLRQEGAELDGIYFCPVAPSIEDRHAIEHFDRKPGPGMLLQASRELGLDLAGSWMIGDSISDMLAGRNAGCRATILVLTGEGGLVEQPNAVVDLVVSDLREASRAILGGWA
jgi:D-glycero-D-manno-heptose 1,7-bisphosphate phosphatase